MDNTANVHFRIKGLAMHWFHSVKPLLHSNHPPQFTTRSLYLGEPLGRLLFFQRCLQRVAWCTFRPTSIFMLALQAMTLLERRLRVDRPLRMSLPASMYQWRSLRLRREVMRPPSSLGVSRTPQPHLRRPVSPLKWRYISPLHRSSTQIQPSVLSYGTSQHIQTRFVDLKYMVLHYHLLILYLASSDRSPR